MNGFQHEQPDYWLTFGNPWEIERPIVNYPIKFYGHVSTATEDGRQVFKWNAGETVSGAAPRRAGPCRSVQLGACSISAPHRSMRHGAGVWSMQHAACSTANGDSMIDAIAILILRQGHGMVQQPLHGAARLSVWLRQRGRMRI